jgi:hypothetical protein
MDNNEYLGKAVVAFMSCTDTALLLRNFWTIQILCYFSLF